MRLGVDGQQYNAQRKFEARRPQCAVQRSAASVRWAVLDGHERSLVRDSILATNFGQCSKPTKED